MTTAADLFELVYQQLMPRAGTPDPTAAGARIRRPGDLPTQSDDYPIIKLRLVGETKLSQGKGSIGFTTTPIIRVVGEVSAPADASDPLTSQIEAKLWALQRQIELALINAYPLFLHVQELVSVQTQLAYTVQATHLAGVQSDYSFEIYQSADDFAAPPVAPLLGLDFVDPNHPGVAFKVDLSA